MKGNVIQMNTLHLNSVRLNGIGKVQSVSLKGGSTEDPVFPPVEPPIEPTTYTLSASVTNGKVSATLNGSSVNLPFTANEGDTIVLEVTPNDGYTFEGWNDGNTDNPRSITMTADVVLSAECVEVVQPPVGNYIQFEDKAVEAICVANWSSDGIGLTMEDAAAVTDIGATFRGNTEITSFDEFEYFTGVTFLGTSTNQTSGGAFYGCTSLQSIKLPSSVTHLRPGAFYNCTSLRSVGDLSNIKQIDIYAFAGTILEGEINLASAEGIISYKSFTKTNITKIVSLGNATILGGSTQSTTGAFAECGLLQSVELPSTLTEIQNWVFYKCAALETIICRASTPPTLGASVFNGSTCPIYVPDASVEAYKTAVNWVSFADRIHPLSEIEGSLVFYDKLVGDGTAYINTEYYAKGLDSFSCQYDAPAKLNGFLFGCKNTNLNFGLVVYESNSSYVLWGSNQAKQVFMNNSLGRTLRLYTNFEDGSYYRYLDSTKLGSADIYATQVSTTPLLVFACHKSATDTSADRPYKGAIRAFSITDIDGNTIMSLRPCTFAGEAGMWDEVGNKFYGNAAASGEFSVANDE